MASTGNTLWTRLQLVETEHEAHDLLRRLPDVLQTTVASAGGSGDWFRLGKAFTPSPDSTSAWSFVLWDHYGPGGASAPIWAGWSRLIGGAPIRRGDAGSSADCLLGLESRWRTPVVVHVAGLPSDSSLIAAVAMAVADALIVQHLWQRGLRDDWFDVCQAAGFGDPRLPVNLDEMTVCLAAPIENWLSLVDGDQPDRKGLSTVQLQVVHALRDALRSLGLDVQFTSLEDRRTERFVADLRVLPYPLPRLARTSPVARRSMIDGQVRRLNGEELADIDAMGKKGRTRRS